VIEQPPNTSKQRGTLRAAADAERLDVTGVNEDANGLARPHMSTDNPIHPQVRVGHIHLKVAELDRAIAFYHDVLALK